MNIDINCILTVTPLTRIGISPWQPIVDLDECCKSTISAHATRFNMVIRCNCNREFKFELHVESSKHVEIGVPPMTAAC